MTLDYYSVLQVVNNAEQEVIEAAYRRLALKYHPDVNKSPDAPERMKQINEAFEVLGDPVKRAYYDESTRTSQTEHPPSQNQPPPEQDHKSPRPSSRQRREQEAPPFVACQVCGRSDATLRASVFLYVVSILVFSFKRGGGAGVYCRDCRRKRIVGYTLLSLLCGPWGIPWGVFWTIEAVFRNLGGGVQPKEVNGPLLRALAVYLLSIGQKAEAIEALNASLKFQDHPQVHSVLRELGFDSGRGNQKESSSGLEFLSRSFFIAFVLLSATLFSVIYLTQTYYLSTESVRPTIANSRQEAVLPTTASYTYSTQAPQPSPTDASTRVPGFLYYVTPFAKRTLVVCTDSANQRAGPGINYAVLDTTIRGDKWDVFGKAGEWFYLGYDDSGNNFFMHESTLCEKMQPQSTNIPTTQPAGFKYAAPRIATPETNPPLFSGDIILTWYLWGVLADDEWFEVRGWKEGMNERNSLAWVKESSYLFRVREQNLPDWISGRGQYYLSVRVIKGKNGSWQADLSDESFPPFKLHW